MKLVDARRAVDHPITIGAAIIVLALGSLNYPMMPLIVGALADHLAMSPQQTGIVASADTFGMFVASASALYWSRRFDWRHIAFLLSLSLVIAHLASAIGQTLWSVAAARVFAGFFGGAMMALGNTVLGDTRDRERHIALFNIVQMGIVAVAFVIAPLTVKAAGTYGIFTFLAVLVAPAMLVGWCLPAAGNWPVAVPVQASGEEEPLRARIAWVLAGAFPVFLFFLAYGASWTYMERVGVAGGLSRDTVSHALSLSVFAAVIGSAISWVLGTRLGRIVPLFVTVIFQFVSIAILLADGANAGAYTAAVCIYFFFINFPAPYQIGTTLIVDRTGRGAIVFLLMLKAGVVVGPFVASRFVTPQDFSGALWIAAGFFGLSYLNSWLVTRLARARAVAADAPVMLPELLEPLP